MKAKKALAEKVGERLERLRTVDIPEIDEGISVESLRLLEKFLEAHQLAAARLKSARSETQIAKSNLVVAEQELRDQYKVIKKQMKQHKRGRRTK